MPLLQSSRHFLPFSTYVTPLIYARPRLRLLLLFLLFIASFEPLGSGTSIYFLDNRPFFSCLFFLFDFYCQWLHRIGCVRLSSSFSVGVGFVRGSLRFLEYISPYVRVCLAAWLHKLLGCLPLAFYGWMFFGLRVSRGEAMLPCATSMWREYPRGHGVDAGKDLDACFNLNLTRIFYACLGERLTCSSGS